ncbi:hypothetical protein FHR99_003150 [Litorivivens lipolytica]|uniref:Uncharacterized protein n=1 Tax=Litorivivens lipolytica TaxID=1524264 RepID=A0A7W4W7F9_9GAMM|nr:hypothetical protein [Litorivivens lipolytica]MBB3048876.1 hypothetical protein [Litorivivens lipolytica]
MSIRKAFSGAVAFVALGMAGAVNAATLNLAEGVDLYDALDAYKIEMENELLQRGKNYRLAYGVAGIAGAQGSTAYVTSINTAYQFALAQAYTQLANELGADLIAAETGIQTTSTGGPAEALLASCESDHKAAKAAAQADESFLDVVKGAIRNFTTSDEEKAEKRKLDSVIECSSTVDRRLITDVLSRSVSDAFSGARIVQTAVHNGQMAVVVGLSPDTAEVAGVLSGQRGAAQTNPGARAEIAQWIQEQMSNQPGSMLGMVGTRMTKLSNGEWAVIGFGLAPASESGGSSILNSNRMQSERKMAENNAARELARFANMSLDHSLNQSVRDDTHVQVKKRIEGDSETISQAQESVVISQLNQNFNTQSVLKLKGASKLYAKKVSDEAAGVDFYLTAYAWSPSMLSSAENFRAQTAEAFQAGKTSGGNRQGARASSATATGNVTSNPRIQEDW